MNTALFCAWGALYLMNVGLGFLSGVTGFVKAALVVLALSSFVPGFWLLLRGFRENNKKLILTVRRISLAVLVLTTVLFAVFLFCAAFASETVVNVIFVLLNLVSAPMFSGQYWILSLFLWACLLSATFLKTDRK